MTAVTGLVLQRDGKIVVAGEFDTDGLARARNAQVLIKRLNPDGSLDRAFLPEDGVRIEALDIPSVNTLLPQRDGKLLLLGRFYSVNGVDRRGIARIHGASVPSLDYIQRNGDGVTFSFLALAAWNYRLESRDGQESSWAAVETFPGDDTVKTVAAAYSSAHQQFYRVTAEPKP